MSVWKLAVNPVFFGYRMLDVMVDVEPESGKADMIRKLKLVHGVIVIVNFYGRALKIILIDDTDQSRSRTVQLISRITNAEKVTMYRIALPKSDTKHLTETDIAIIRALSADARKPSALVAKEIGFSTRTVRNRIEKLRKEKTLFTLPNLSVGGIKGLIPVHLSYVYSSTEAKGSVDRLLISHFDADYLWGGFSDRENGFLVLIAQAMIDVQRILDWTKVQPGIASARIDIPVEMINFPEKLGELLTVRDYRQPLCHNVNAL